MRRIGLYSDQSETFDDLPRVNSVHNRAFYDEIVEISRLLDFKKPCFDYRHKRQFSLGSAQAFMLELAITMPAFIEELKKYMVKGGIGYSLTHINYSDRYWETPAKKEPKKVKETVEEGQRMRNNETGIIFTLRAKSDKQWYLESPTGTRTPIVSFKTMQKTLEEKYTSLPKRPNFTLGGINE